MHEVATRPALLPDTVVGLAPRLLEVLDPRPHLRPALRIHLAGGDARRKGHPRDLPVDVELILPGGRVSYPYRPRALVARQPVELELLKIALALGPVHDL